MELSFGREQLVEMLKSNRAAHRRIFEEAVEGYRKEAVTQLETHIRQIRDGALKRVYVSLPMPEEHTADYDRIIAMIEMSPDPTIVLDDDEFRMYVQDDWDWKRAFLTSNAAYSLIASKQLGSEA